MGRKGLSLAKSAVIVLLMGGTLSGFYYVIQSQGPPPHSLDSLASVDGKYLVYHNSVPSQNISLSWKFTFSQLSGKRVNVTNSVIGTTGSGQYLRRVNATNWFVVDTSTRAVISGRITYSGPWFEDPTSNSFVGSTIFLWAPTDVHVGSDLPISFGPSTSQQVQSVPIVGQESIVIGGRTFSTWKASASGWTFWYDQSSGFLIRFEFLGDTLALVGGVL